MAHFDPRLVDLHDGDNPDGSDHDFYRGLAESVAVRRILDLGCGAGMLTIGLATGGRTVIGIDPSETMLGIARRRPGTERVQWICGDSRSIPAGVFDFALMTGNVAQHIEDGDWSRTLTDLRTALCVGGTLAFESRSSHARTDVGAGGVPCQWPRDGHPIGGVAGGNRGGGRCSLSNIAISACQI
ncbi:MAG: class I SAM-dependent methyltransferase [Microbacterium sp.]